jgi:hypothetical protein
MRHTSAVLNFIEHMAQEQLKYENIFSENAEILRTYPNSTQQWRKSNSRHWESTQKNADEYLAYCNESVALCRGTLTS